MQRSRSSCPDVYTPAALSRYHARGDAVQGNPDAQQSMCLARRIVGLGVLLHFFIDIVKAGVCFHTVFIDDHVEKVCVG